MRLTCPTSRTNLQPYFHGWRRISSSPAEAGIAIVAAAGDDPAWTEGTGMTVSSCCMLTRRCLLVVAAVLLAGASLTCPPALAAARSEEHTSELQSREKLVCRLLLEKKNNSN